MYRKLYTKSAKWLAIKQMCVKESKNIFRGKVWSGTDLYTLGISAEQSINLSSLDWTNCQQSNNHSIDKLTKKKSLGGKKWGKLPSNSDMTKGFLSLIQKSFERNVVWNELKTCCNCINKRIAKIAKYLCNQLYVVFFD